MTNSFLKFCKYIDFIPPTNWEQNQILDVKKDINGNFFVIVAFYVMPEIKDFEKFLESAQISDKNFIIEWRFQNQFCEYDLLLQYFNYLMKKDQIIDLEFTRKMVEIQLNEDNVYCFFFHNKNLWEEISDKLEAIFLSFKNFGLDKIKVDFKFNFAKYQKIENKQKEKERKIEKQQEIFEFHQKNNNKNLISDFGYSNKKVFVPLSINKCFKSFEKMVSIEGEIFKKDIIQTKSGMWIFIFSISDFSNAITVKLFCKKEERKAQINEFKTGDSILVNGELNYDEYLKEKTVVANSISKIESIQKAREDNATHKRLELSVRTKMSAMDGITTPEDYLKVAEQMGHKALAIVDTNSVQSFPEFFHLSKKSSVKPIYGASFSILEKENNVILNYQNFKLEDQKYVIFDLETTGLSARFNEIIEFGAAVIIGGKVVHQHQFFIKPQQPIPADITDITHITNEMVANAIDQATGIKKIVEILKDSVIIAHNAKFDLSFIEEKMAEFNLEKTKFITIDTLNLARILLPSMKKFTLKDVAKHYSINYDSEVAHRADYDANILAHVWLAILRDLKIKNIFDAEQLKNLQEKNFYKKQYPYEITVLAKNQAGLKELFKLISLASTENLQDEPRLFFEDLPKSENLLYGSSTLNSRLIDHLFYGTKEKLYHEISQYDYIEIPPLQDFLHMFNRGLNKTEIEKALKDLILEAKKQQKLVVAVSDARYINAEEKFLHEIYISSKGLGGVNHYLYKYNETNPVYPTQNYLTTDEMKAQFSFLIDPDLIDEIVVDNPNKIADAIDDNIIVIKEGLFPPVFDNSKENLEKLVWDNAKKMYGDPLPEIVHARLERELEPILKYGFDVVYWLSYKLVAKSLSDGYIVGSRGSVGSSLVATVAGITEVNPLVPHYICKQCYFSEFFINSEYSSGFDLPDKNCPKCDIIMDKDGQTIPFEAFLGLEADKVPDIDLNFSGDYQAKVHDEIRNLFGENHTFRSGTISTNAEKTAFGYVKKYEEMTGKEFSNSFLNFLSTKLSKVKRTSGQHPGGIIVVPKEYDIEDFTPVNFPANDASSSWKTTHFDYKAIHDNLLKLDILGHVNPTAIKMLEDLTGVKVDQIPKSDEKIISLFSSLDALGIKPEDVSGETTAAQGIPEFGTSFVRQMLKSAKVTSFADLVSISGLSHGENVWKNNAEDLITKENKQFKDIVSCRDDIMEYLVRKGFDKRFSFDIMEQVRKGKSISKEQETMLQEKAVPQWYIDSMKKIKYMFPKAHAVAYVIMAWRIGFYKIYYPLAYYATYFSTRSDVFDIETLIAGKQAISEKLKDFTSRKFKKDSLLKLSTKEENLIPVFAIAEEMYARGFKIENIQIGKSKVKEWIINYENNSLIPPYITLDGLGETQAQSIVDALKEGDFLSIEDFVRRTTINQTLISKMRELNIFSELDETNQMTLF
ncbi:PolC-type DNA polymerase III [Mycoplasma iguanae]|uniref:DNA polymerase III PolC-type n=1 Tax=Mycoplasma iguanae TaxID=292461 RepID=A0ABY5RBT5_9MOLU|nr:PolC-type DNA polymerase III [Mycoplasma iguanae]UVD81807.1 PolC-type DNA polymerase III [Mycoplasma iguanae]